MVIHNPFNYSDQCKRPMTIFSGMIVMLLAFHSVLLAQAENWKLPPTSPVNKTLHYPKLANYFHMNMSESHVTFRDERLAQWDVVIFDPDLVVSEKISFSKIRTVNAEVKILCWIPLQGPGSWTSLYNGFKTSWNCKDISGNTLVAPWGVPIANPFADHYGYIHHILDYLKTKGTNYNGVMYDCLWESPWSGADINQDGILNKADQDSLRNAQLFLLKETRKLFPDWIISGNGGRPWGSGCSYYSYSNGCMHENAFGNEFGNSGSTWNYFWQAYKVIGEKSQSPVYHLIIADVRQDRTQGQAENLKELTADDKRRFRLGLIGSMLLDHDYFGFDRGDCLHGQLWWFKEYDVDLGDVADSYKENKYGQGLLSREFENGSIVLNPMDNDAQVAFTDIHIDVSFDIQSKLFRLPAQDARIYMKNGLYLLAVSGHVRANDQSGIEGVTLGGLPGSPVTDSGGYYSAVVSYGWNGTVTPTKAGYTFNPTNRPYDNVTCNQSEQD